MAEENNEEKREPAEEQRCPICLEQYDDKTFIDPCFHCFCFRCLVQWAEVTTTCPMCKTSFTTLIHNVEAIDKYTQYTVEPKTKSSSLEISISEARRFRYRTTRVPGQPRNPPATSSSSQSQSNHEDSDSLEREAARERERRERRERRRRAAQQMSNPASDERRRVVYSLGLWAQPPHAERRKERVRDISARFFRQNPACTHRLVPWLTREFKVLLGEDHTQFMIQLVLSLVSKIELDGEEFPEHLQPFLQTKTSHFLHELVLFAQSPLNLAAYDGSVRYDWPTGGGGGGGVRTRDNWDPEATVNNLSHQLEPVTSPEAGRSGLSSHEIQERLFHELTATHWDDSPPFLQLNSPSPAHSSSSSPILIHCSDSEDERERVVAGSPSNQDQSPRVTNSSAAPSNIDVFGSYSGHGDNSIHIPSEGGNPSNSTQSSTIASALSQLSTSAALEQAVDSSSVTGESKEKQKGDSIGQDGESGDGEEVREEEGDGEVSDSKEESSSIQSSVTEGKDTHCSSSSFKSGLKKSGRSGRCFRSRATSSSDEPTIEEPGSSASLTDNTTPTEKASAKPSGVEEEETAREDEFIVINAESEEDGGLTEPQLSRPISSDKQKKTDGVEAPYSKARKRSKKRDTEEKESSRKKRREGPRRGERRDSSERYYESYSDREYEEKRGRRKSRSRTTGRRRRRSRRSRTPERRRRRRTSGTTEKRGRSRTPERGRRSRSRTPEWRHHDFELEDYCIRDRSHRSRLYSDDYHYTSPHRRESSDSERRGEREKKRRRKRKRREGECSKTREEDEVEGKGSERKDDDSQLHNELSHIDEEILQHKRQVLKAMLRSERLRLLHRQLQGRDLLDDVAELKKPLIINETTSTGEVEKQLAELDQAIVDQKKKVLHVMKRMEQNNPLL